MKKAILFVLSVVLLCFIFVTACNQSRLPTAYELWKDADVQNELNGENDDIDKGILVDSLTQAFGEDHIYRVQAGTSYETGEVPIFLITLYGSVLEEQWYTEIIEKLHKYVESNKFEKMGDSIWIFKTLLSWNPEDAEKHKYSKEYINLSEISLLIDNGKLHTSIIQHAEYYEGWNSAVEAEKKLDSHYNIYRKIFEKYDLPRDAFEDKLLDLEEKYGLHEQ